jgi:CCR4-NOT transcription complex subunit 6
MNSKGDNLNSSSSGSLTNNLLLGHHHNHHHHHNNHNHHSSHHGNHLSHGNGNGLTSNGSLNAKLFNLTNSTSNNNNSNSNSNNNNNNTQMTALMMQTPYGQQPGLLNGNGLSSNNSNNQSNDSDQPHQLNSYTYKQMQTQSQIPWFEVEIKGMVKNLSPKLWTWTHLRCLYLNDNNLMRLPPVVSSLNNLQILDASNNKIRTLPAEIGDMTSLRELYLSNNQLRVLPFELGKLFKLQSLALKGNPLTSDIMAIYSEPNGSQKLLIHLLDQLAITCPPPPRRPWVILAEPNTSVNNPCLFTTMCYNVLCDKYATRQYYGYCPAWALTWEYRKKLILDDIKNFNADIIALQELETEQFYQFFLPELKQFDYDGIFSPKSRAKTMAEQDKKHVDGCAIFFKTSRFQLVKDYLIEFNQIAMATAEGSEDMLNRVMTKDNIGLAALLEIKQDDDSNNKQMVLICTAHIHWDPDYCDVKLIQTLMLTNEIKMIIEQAQREFRPHQLTSQNQPVDCSSTIPVVICADLNSLPESGVIEYLRTGKILANHVDFKELGYDSCLQKINTSDKPSELSHNLKLDCAYDKEITPYTNYTLVFEFILYTSILNFNNYNNYNLFYLYIFIIYPLFY